VKDEIPLPLVLGLALVLTALPLARGLDGEAEKKEAAPATEEKKEVAAPEEPTAEKPAGLVGNIVAVVPESWTLVVDVPLGKATLRIGAALTDKTKITAAGKAGSLESLKPGARVRIHFRRVATGDEAISVDVLRDARG
jgi:hypothetical protein